MQWKNHSASYYKGYVLQGGVFVVFWHDFEVIFCPLNFIFFMKKHYNSKSVVNMCWFEPAFIQFGQYIHSNSLKTWDRWNISHMRVFHLSQAFSGLLCIYFPKCVKAGSNQHIFTTFLLSQCFFMKQIKFKGQKMTSKSCQNTRKWPLCIKYPL